MHHHLIAALRGFGVYFLLCAFSLLVGRGLARLFRLKTDERAEAALAGTLTYVVWTVVVGLIAGIGIALRLAAPWIWGASGLLAVVGLLPPWPRLRVFVPCFLLCAILPVATTLRAFRAGLTECPESISFDGFFYAASGEYAWEHGLNDYRNYEDLAAIRPAAFMKIAVWEHGPSDQGDLNMIHQFAATFPGHRCIGMSLLAFLSPLVHAGDTIADGPLLHAWSLFSLAAAVLLYWIARGKPAAFVFPATALAVAAGWSAAPFWLNQLDNGLCLPYLAALVAILELWGPESRSRWLLLGITLAGLWYVYPPGAPFVIVAATLIALPRLWCERRAWRSWLGGTAVATVLCLVLWAPGGLGSIPQMLGCYKAIWDTSCLLPGISKLRCYPSAFWGLGGETIANDATRLSNFTGFVFCCLVPVGVVRLARKGEWGIPVCVLFITGFCFYSLFRLNYSYPFLKLFTLTWWCFAALVVSGAAALVERVRVLHYRSAVIAVVILLGCECQFFSALWERKPAWPSRYSHESVKTLRRVSDVCKGLDKGSVMIAVDDWLAHLSAAYYLRDKDVLIATRQSWLGFPCFETFQKRFHQPSVEGVRYLLCDDCGWNTDIAANAELIWSGGPYKLWHLNLSTGADPAILHVAPGIGHEKRGAAESFNVGTFPTVVFLSSREGGLTDVRLGCFPTAHALDSQTYTLRISTSKGYQGHFCLRKGDNSLSIPLTAGVNRLEFSVTDAARPGTSRTDTDLNLVRLSDIRMSPAGSHSQLTRK